MRGAVQRLRHGWRQAVRIARQMIGVPDYDTYVSHMRRHHPERAVMTYAEFFNNRLQARYRAGGGRCC
ncbi:YbdD/YjiX family protein [Corallococcus sp. Z5C101001]|uniref:YbdD/YjiX family protein n=1 Tax=Corallococcus sp. Z5C101001 TaxID=2596829 RepID=UPI00117D9BC7|nr:YbdD/YjiX family protein [Corallococcus sp. Z5C101001]TSC32802.1 YbdD/YjiX family protein [Corallococcus sp. Z5C101001]